MRAWYQDQGHCTGPSGQGLLYGVSMNKDDRSELEAVLVGKFTAKRPTGDAGRMVNYYTGSHQLYEISLSSEHSSSC